MMRIVYNIYINIYKIKKIILLPKVNFLFVKMIKFMKGYRSNLQIKEIIIFKNYTNNEKLADNVIKTNK